VETRIHVHQPATTGHAYEPVGPHHVRTLLRITARYLPIPDTTVIDVGSGKGRVLFVAAAWPYRRVIGVEHAQTLHMIAEQNRCRYRGRVVAPIDLVCSDARVYEWPTGPLALVFFNPFPADILRVIIGRVINTARHPVAYLCVGRYTARDTFEAWPEIRCLHNDTYRAIYLSAPGNS